MLLNNAGKQQQKKHILIYRQQLPMYNFLKFVTSERVKSYYINTTLYQIIHKFGLCAAATDKTS